jgi:uncharacterized protein YkwD
MSRLSLCLFSFCLTLLLGGAGLADQPKTKDERLRAELVKAHNKVRAANKLSPLVANPKLDAAALAHARDMAEHDHMTHDGSDGSKPSERVERQGYRFQATAENVAARQRTVPEVMKGWMNSEGHRKNILEKGYTEIGVARVPSEDGIYYWCAVFGRPWVDLEPREACAEVVGLINALREEKDQPALQVNALLQEAAESSARDMAEQGAFETKGGKAGRLPAQRAQDAGYRFRAAATEVAAGTPTPAATVNAWADRPKTLKRFLNEEFRDIGVGVATTEKGVPYWCLLLARPAEPGDVPREGPEP